MLTLILGGARSGKSRLAQQLAATAERVVYIATLCAGDDPEMAARVERHRAERPSSWQTVEEPLAVAGVVERAAKECDAILLDCLTLWLSNLFFEYRNQPGPESSNEYSNDARQQVEDAAHAQLQRIAAAARQFRVILVSNELGCGTVPELALTRDFRDTQGLLNQWAAEAADEVILTVAGLPLYLKTALRSKDAA